MRHNDDKFVLFSSVDPEFRAATAHAVLLLSPCLLITVSMDMK